MPTPTRHADPAAPPLLWVVCLCAEWCGTCRDWRPLVDGVAAEWPQVGWRWLDIEDDAELLDDLDIETFPTVLLARQDQVLFFGPIPPQAELLARLVSDRLGEAMPAAGVVPADVHALWQRLRAAPAPAC